LFYVLPIIGILSGSEMFYTGYLLNDIFQEILIEKIHFLSRKQEIQSLQFLFTTFSITFFPYVFIDVGIAIYVIQKANTLIKPEYKYFMMAEGVIKKILIVGSAVVAGAPEPSTGSNFVHTRTPFGRGWDTEPGDVFTKKDFMKLQQYTGNRLLVDELNTETNKRLVNRDVYQRVIQDPEVRNKILNSYKITDEELYQMGIKTLPEVASSTARKSMESGVSFIGEKVNNGIQSVGNKLKDGFESLKNICTTGESEPLSNKLEWDMDMSDETFEHKQADVPENSPGKKAKKIKIY